MGMVIKQGFFNSIWMFLGLVVGYVNMVLLFPIFLTADQFGLTRVLWAAGTIFAQFALLGGPQILVKFFADFEKKPQERAGFFTLLLIIPLFGYIIFLLAGMLFKGNIISSYANQTSLFADNFSYIYVITFFFIYFSIVEGYLRALFKTTVAAFLKNVMLRLIWLGLIILYEQKLISFETFIFWFSGTYGIILFILIIYTLILGQLKLSIKLSFLTKKRFKIIAEYGLYIILGGSTAYLVNYIDVLMVGGMINLKNVAFYSVAFYLGAVILMPFQGTTNILAPIISDAFSKNNLAKIKEIYQNVSVNLCLVSMLIFLGIWLNADSIFRLLPPDYSSGKYVLLFIALAKLLGASVGVSIFILQYSKYFRSIFWFNISLLVFVVVSNYLLIPFLGIMGAALATLLGQIFIYTLEVIFLYSKMKILPFKFANIKILILGGVVYLIVLFIPEQSNMIIDITLRSIIIVALYLPLAYFWNISEEYSNFTRKYLRIATQFFR